MPRAIDAPKADCPRPATLDVALRSGGGDYRHAGLGECVRYGGTGVAGGSWQLSSPRLHVSQRASVVSPGGENPLHPGQFFGYRNHENQEAGQAA